jgi:hypothetical protein
MTSQQFTAWAEAVFGKYLPAMKAEVEKWLSVYDRFFIAAMREIALHEHPSIYGKPPGVYELEQMKIRAYERGHTLEAIAAANKSTTLIASDVAEEFVSPEEGEKMLAEIREKLAKKAEARCD